MATAKPPLPSSRPPEALRLCLLAWVELLLGFLVLISLYVMLEKQIGKGAVLTFLVLGGALLLLVTGRLVRKVITLRNAKGPMRGKTLAAFWAALLLPVAAGGAIWKLKPAVNPYQARQEQARAALLEFARAERAFRRDFGRYTYNVKELGLPEREGEHAYTVGFPTPCSVGEGSSLEKSRIPFHEYVPSEIRKLEIEEYLQKVRLPADCKDPKEGFEAFAVGALKEGALLDVWRIDEEGQPENVQRGY